MKKRLYLLAGGYGVGKTTFSKQLERKIPNSISLALADGIRENLKKSLSIDEELLYQKPTAEFIRNLIKGYGQYKKNLVGEDYWARLVYMKFIRKNPALSTLIIDDFRFIEEYHYLKEKFDIIDIIYIGEKSKDYHLTEIYKLATIKLEKYPEYDRFIQCTR